MQSAQLAQLGCRDEGLSSPHLDLRLERHRTKRLCRTFMVYELPSRHSQVSIFVHSMREILAAKRVWTVVLLVANERHGWLRSQAGACRLLSARAAHPGAWGFDQSWGAPITQSSILQLCCDDYTNAPKLMAVGRSTLPAGFRIDPHLLE